MPRRRADDLLLFSFWDCINVIITCCLVVFTLLMACVEAEWIFISINNILWMALHIWWLNDDEIVINRACLICTSFIWFPFHLSEWNYAIEWIVSNCLSWLKVLMNIGWRFLSEKLANYFSTEFSSFTFQLNCDILQSSKCLIYFFAKFSFFGHDSILFDHAVQD